MDPGEWRELKRTEDHGNDPITDLGREASVSVEKVTPEKVLGGALSSRRNGCERFCEWTKGFEQARLFHEQYWMIPFCRVAPSLPPHQMF